MYVLERKTKEVDIKIKFSESIGGKVKIDIFR
jgi:hypothetical protein